jgi:hypothetical protein
MNYNIEYYEKMLREYSGRGEMIARIRWDFISIINPQKVLDYGSGVGWFRAWRPPGIEVDSYDIGPVPQTEIRLIMYDISCFWDVLEHVPNTEELEPIFNLSRHIAVTTPIKPAKIPLAKWKHFKPGEHLSMFTLESIEAFFEKYGFYVFKSSTAECPPREDIHSFLFKKEVGK